MTRAKHLNLNGDSIFVIPNGLFSFGEGTVTLTHHKRQVFYRIIKQFERNVNELTSEEFYCLVDTLGGELTL